MTKLAAVLLLFSLMSAAHTPPRNPEPDTIFVNADLYTGFDAPGPPPRALAVRDGRIVAVGSETEVKKLKGGKTQMVDLGGRFVMPGFNDAHLHLASGGFEKVNVDLAGTNSLQEMLARIAARVKETAAGEWVVGRGWDHTRWAAPVLPTRKDLDAVTGNRPAIFTRVDGHIAVANRAALQAGGIVRETPDPPGGKIDRDPRGDPTGILRETAQEFVKSKIPKPSPAQRRRAIELALREAAQFGITSVQDNSSWEDFLVYEDLEREGKLTVRITEWLPFEAPISVLEQHRSRHPQADAMLHTGMLKGFMDGSLGSRTAALLAPYADDPGNSGLPQYAQAQLNQMAADRVAARFQMGFHAIGDRGVEMALQAIAEAERYARQHHIEPPATGGFRHRIEHCQVLAPDQAARFRELNVIASVQPNHLLTDMNWAEARIGPQRAAHSYPWKKFLETGVRLAFGTDYPVEPITPFRGLYAAITRNNEAGTKQHFLEQKISIQQAVAAYTSGAAYAEFAEAGKGVLAPGMLADFVVLDRNITKVTPPELLRTNVLRTVVGGKTVYQKP